ncbi:MAG: radical SAM protein [Thermoplasmata archaeon]|nr:radical SAM protein [Thermoplasmata archaeon]
MYDALLKARLICAGAVTLEIKLPPGYVCRDPAGPHGAQRTVFLEFGKHRVKLGIGKSAFRVVGENGKFFLFEEDKKLMAVNFLKPVYHAPEMAFFNLLPWCKYRCSFCNLPHEGQNDVRIEKYLGLVRKRAEDIRSIAVTSGVGGDGVDVILLREFVEKARKELAVPVGVEPFVTRKEEIDILHNAGATEIKINIHSFDRKVLQRVCPAFLRDTRSLLEHAVKVFGEGRVTTNVLVGLGEGEEILFQGLETLASTGVIANLRFVHGLSSLSPPALLRIAEEQKRVLKRFGLNPGMETMCLRCRSCDIVAGWDV